MNNELTPGENQLFWMLVANGGEAFEDSLSHTKKPNEKPHRDGLLRRRLITAAKKKRQLPGKKPGNAMHLEITPAGWNFCNEVLGWSLPVGKKSKADQFLHWLMPRLKTLMERQSTAANFSDFMNKTAASNSETNVEQNIRAACLELGGGREAVRIRIADLRKRLADVPNDDLSETLRELSRRRELTLYPLDDPRQITPDDEAAAIHSSTGVPQHILYYGGIAS